MSNPVKGRDVHSDVVHPALPMPTLASPTFKGALQHGFDQDNMACDMPKPCEFHLLIVTKRGSCGPTRKLILFRI